MHKILLLQSREPSLAAYEKRLIAETAQCAEEDLYSVNSLTDDLSDLAELRPRSVIMSGSSRFNISEGEQPWFGAARALLQRCRQEQRPFLGLCFGMQFLAYACGAKVRRYPEKAEMGAKLVSWQAGATSKFFRLPEQFWANNVHADFVEELPAELKVLASTADCPVQIIEHQSAPLYGVQFHPEHSPASIAEYAKHYAGLYGLESGEALAAAMVEHHSAVKAVLVDFVRLA